MKTIRLVPVLLSLLCLLSQPLRLAAQSTAFTYQGRLNTNNASFTGTAEFRFTLWDAASGGNAVATNNPASVIASVAGGLFTTPLDFGSSPFNGQDRFLQIEARTVLGPFTTLTPRQPLSPAPYALHAANSAAAATVSGTIPVGQIAGTLPLAQLPAAVVTNGASGVNFSGTFSGNGAGVTNLNLAASSGGAIALSGNFVLSSTVGVGFTPQSVTSADVNGDGKPDLISANYGNGSGNTLSVVTNNGSGLFVLSSSPVLGFVPQSVTSADVNGDGKADLIAGGGGLAVLTNNGSGGFALSASFGVGGISVTTTDVNGDARPDLISANNFNNTLSILTNKGGGGFELASLPGVGNGPHSVAAADVNGDGQPDLISANYNADTLTVVTNNGSGGFALASEPGGGSAPYSVTAADVNGDGRPDLISANFETNTVTVLTNNGGGGFVVASSPVVGSFPQSVTSADVNEDGKPDLICATYGTGAGTVTVLTNNGGGFALGASLVVGSTLHSVTTADVNGDGKLDLISASYGASKLTVFINTPIFAGIFTGNGSGLTSVPANVALLNASQTFTEPNAFNSGVTVNSPAALSFGNQPRQMINLWGTEYGLGVQDSAGYFRSGGDFFWYRGGSHTVTNGDAGGGVPLMSLKRSGNLGLGTTSPAYSLDVQSSQAVGRFTTTNNSYGSVLVLQNTDASPIYLGAINFETTNSTPGQIGYLGNDEMAFRVGGTERMRLTVAGMTLNGTLSQSSDRNVKEDFAGVDAQEVLKKVAGLPLQSWSYTNRPGVKHVGPMAQDFRAAFGLGEDDKHIATVDADGVALAAIQGLNQRLTEELKRRDTENAELKKTVADLKEMVERLASLRKEP